MTDGRNPDAMDSPPCPNCLENRNGIFSERDDHRWRCCKCDAIFEGPTPAQLRHYRNARDYPLPRYRRATPTNTARHERRSEDREKSREHALIGFAEVIAE